MLLLSVIAPLTLIGEMDGMVTSYDLDNGGWDCEESDGEITFCRNPIHIEWRAGRRGELRQLRAESPIVGFDAVDGSKQKRILR
jgi:hypothetical protein